MMNKTIRSIGLQCKILDKLDKACLPIIGKICLIIYRQPSQGGPVPPPLLVAVVYPYINIPIPQLDIN